MAGEMHYDTNPTRLPGQSPAEAYRATGRPEVADQIERPPVVVEVLRYADPQGWGFHYLELNIGGRFAYRAVKPPRLCFGETATEEWDQLTGYTSHKLADLDEEEQHVELLARYIGQQVIPLEWKTEYAAGDPEITRRITVWIKEKTA